MISPYQQGRADEWTGIRTLVLNRALAPGQTEEGVRVLESLLVALDNRKPPLIAKPQGG